MLTIGIVLRARCLGTFALRGSGDWNTESALRRGRGLLQYLVSYPNVQASRETLAEALWPEHDGDGVTHRLHLAVSGVRAALRPLLSGIDAIRCVAGSYTWHPAVTIESDVEQFLRAAREGSLEEIRDAVALYVGEFLAGHNSDWIYPLRARCANAYVTMLERLATTAIAEHDYPRALEWSLRLAESDRSHEGAARMVMQVLAAGGRRGAALAQFEELKRYLRVHLDIVPAPQTEALRAEIIRGAISV